MSSHAVDLAVCAKSLSRSSILNTISYGPLLIMRHFLYQGFIPVLLCDSVRSIFPNAVVLKSCSFLVQMLVTDSDSLLVLY